MKISLKALAEFFPNLDSKTLFQKSAELRESLPLAGIEIGVIKKLGTDLDKVVVGKIIEAQKHPKADRLRVCKVQHVESGDLLQIVCGAPNARAGIKVALAPVGCVLPGNFEIKAAEIRGVTSAGMLCSGKELGLSEDSDGILELPDSAPVGSGFVKALGIEDQIWEIELTPDRGDCLSHWGMAREVGRLLKMSPSMIEGEPLASGESSSDLALVNVEVQDTKACPIYIAQLFEGFQNKKSPDWLERRLHNLGLRTHSAIVDITNCVLMELGSPLHAFDADKVNGRLLVRRAKSSEKLKTLDGVLRELSPDDLVIADSEGPLALAGVMGGEDSAVTEKTSRVILECAIFDPEVIRATVKRHKLNSDSSHRFERGVDPSIRLKVLGRASLLFKQICGARRRGAYVEVRDEKSSKFGREHEVNLDLRLFRDVSGIEATAEEVTRAFQSVLISSTVKSPNLVGVTVPSHRQDLVREVDLIEEAARLLGYNRIQARYPIQQQGSRSRTRAIYRKMRLCREALLSQGLTEVMPYGFIGDSELTFLPDFVKEQVVGLENPLSQDWRYLRPNLFFGILSCIRRHLGLGQGRGGLFDSGTVFSQKFEKEPVNRSSGVNEFFHLGWGLFGPRIPLHWSTDKSRNDKDESVDFFDAKGIGENVFSELQTLEPRLSGAQLMGLDELLLNSELKKVLDVTAPWIPVKLLHPGRTGIYYLAGAGPMGVQNVVGFVGELHPFFAPDILNLPTGSQVGVAFGELRIGGALLGQIESVKSEPQLILPKGQMKAEVRFPIVERDVALSLPANMRASEVERTLKKAGGPLLVGLQCIDRFINPSTPDRVSLAFRLSLQSAEGTLSEEQIKKVFQDLLDAAKTRHQAALR